MSDGFTFCAQSILEVRMTNNAYCRRHKSGKYTQIRFSNCSDIRFVLGQGLRWVNKSHKKVTNNEGIIVKLCKNSVWKWLRQRICVFRGRG